MVSDSHADDSISPLSSKFSNDWFYKRMNALSSLITFTIYSLSNRCKWKWNANQHNPTNLTSVAESSHTTYFYFRQGMETLLNNYIYIIALCGAGSLRKRHWCPRYNLSDGIILCSNFQSTLPRYCTSCGDKSRLICGCVIAEDVIIYSSLQTKDRRTSRWKILCALYTDSVSTSRFSSVYNGPSKKGVWI